MAVFRCATFFWGENKPCLKICALLQKYRQQCVRIASLMVGLGSECVGSRVFFPILNSLLVSYGSYSLWCNVCNSPLAGWCNLREKCARVHPESRDFEPLLALSCALWVGGMAYSLTPVNHSDVSQSRASLSSCMWKQVDSAFLRVRSTVQ